MSLGLLILEIHIPGCQSLKEKRRRLKPLLVRLQREFNISVAEIDHLDTWQRAVIACALVSNQHAHTQRSLAKIGDWLDRHHPDIDVIAEQVEFF